MCSVFQPNCNHLRARAQSSGPGRWPAVEEGWEWQGGEISLHYVPSHLRPAESKAAVQGGGLRQKGGGSGKQVRSVCNMFQLILRPAESKAVVHGGGLRHGTWGEWQALVSDTCNTLPAQPRAVRAHAPTCKRCWLLLRPRPPPEQGTHAKHATRACLAKSTLQVQPSAMQALAPTPKRCCIHVKHHTPGSPCQSIAAPPRTAGRPCSSSPPQTRTPPDPGAPPPACVGGQQVACQELPAGSELLGQQANQDTTPSGCPPPPAWQQQDSGYVMHPPSQP